ncbi:hypothetical protein AB5I41_07955 [Sphingomonas sp. MMS24-JH45]
MRESGRCAICGGKVAVVTGGASGIGLALAQGAQGARREGRRRRYPRGLGAGPGGGAARCRRGAGGAHRRRLPR